jgi:hypothetical protein
MKKPHKQGSDMSSKRATTEETEADLEARIRAAIKLAFQWLPDGAIKHQIKFSFKFGRQTLMVDAGKSRAEARLDILLEKDGKPLAVMELKRPGIKLTDDDGAQGLSYARLVQPPAPLVVVTNGTEVTTLETSSGKPWQPASASEDTFKALLTQASRVASADIRHAVDTLMGTAPRVWMQAVRCVSSDTIEELTASWDEPALPFVADFLAPRGATYQLWRNLVAGERLQVLEGPPLSGKSNVLRELCLCTKQSDTVATLYVETGVGRGALQTVADAISRSLNWPVSPQEARDWLIRVSHHEGARLVLAFDGIQEANATSVREIEDLSSSTFGPSLSVVVAMDEAVSQSVLTSPNRRSLSPLGRRSKLVRVGHLRDGEFKLAQELLGQRRLFLMKGADMAPEYREPWVLRAICSSAQAALESRPDTQALSLPSLLGPKLLDLVRKRFADVPELRRMFRGLARSMITDAQDTARSPELVLQQLEMGVIRRDAARAELEPDDLQWLIDHGFVRPGMHDVAGPTILVRLPELLASEMAHVLADELVKRGRKNLHETAAWISGAASNLPLGEVVAAQAIIDAAKRPNGLPVGLISALVEMPPEREILEVGGRYAMMLPNGAMVEIALQPDGKGFVVIDGEQHEIDLGDEEQVTFKNIHPWLILSHVASTPFEVEGEHGPVREDPNLLLQIGTCPVPLRGNRGPESFRMLPTTDMPGGVSIVHSDAGVIEPITLGILDYLSTAKDQADNWIAIAGSSGSIALLSRLHTALGVLAAFETHARSEWAEAQLRTMVLPKLREAITNAEEPAPHS